MGFLISLNILARPNPRLIYRPLALGPAPGNYEIKFNGDLFQTSGHFDNDGTSTPLEENEAFSQFNGELSLGYALSRRLSWEGGLRLRQNASNYLQENEISTVTNSGLESYYLKGRLSIPSSKSLIYALTLQVRQSNEENRNYNNRAEIPADQIILGDGGTEFSLGLNLSYLRTKKHILNTQVLLRRPGNNLSSEMPYLVTSDWTHRPWVLSLGVEGIFSLKNDEFSNSPEQKPFQATGSTYLYNSINREYFAPRAGVYYAFNNLRLGFEVAPVLFGVSTDKGTRFGVNLLWSGNKRLREKRKIKRFKEYSIEANVVKVSARGKFILIDKGLSSDIEKGMKFDIFANNDSGKNVLIAEGIVYKSSGNKAVIKLTRKMKRIRIKKGFAARAR